MKEWETREPGQKVGTVPGHERRGTAPPGIARIHRLRSPRAGRGRPPDPKDLIAGWTENVSGKKFLEAGDIKQAEEHLLRAIELNPVFFNPYVDLARLRFERGDVEGGLAILKHGVDRNPGSAAVKIEYARGLADADRPEEALAVLREAEAQMVYGEHETVDAMIGSYPVAPGALIKKRRAICAGRSRSNPTTPRRPGTWAIASTGPDSRRKPCLSTNGRRPGCPKTRSRRPSWPCAKPP